MPYLENTQVYYVITALTIRVAETRVFSSGKIFLVTKTNFVKHWIANVFFEEIIGSRRQLCCRFFRNKFAF